MWLLALDAAHYTRGISKSVRSGDDGAAFDQPIPDVTRAVMTRWLNENPERSVLPQLASASDLITIIRSTPGYTTLSEADLAILLGKEPPAGVRWLDATKGDNRSRLVRQAMTVIYENLKGKNHSERKVILDEWVRCLLIEASARGLQPDDFMSKRVFAGAGTKPAGSTKKPKSRSMLAGTGIWRKLARRLGF